MPKFTVETRSKHSPEETYKKIKSLLDSDRDLRKMDSNYKCEFNDQQLTGRAKGGKFEADMRVLNEAQGARVQIEVNLPLMLTPVKGLVQSTLQKKLESILS